MYIYIYIYIYIYTCLCVRKKKGSMENQIDIFNHRDCKSYSEICQSDPYFETCQSVFHTASLFLILSDFIPNLTHIYSILYIKYLNRYVIMILLYIYIYKYIYILK